MSSSCALTASTAAGSFIGSDIRHCKHWIVVRIGASSREGAAAGSTRGLLPDRPPRFLGHSVCLAGSEPFSSKADKAGIVNVALEGGEVDMVESAGLAGETTVARENFIPFYRQIANAIEADIAAGRLKPGDQLPSTPKLVEQYGHSAGTVRKAIDELVAAGVLRGHQGVAVFVAERPAVG